MDLNYLDHEDETTKLIAVAQSRKAKREMEKKEEASDAAVEAADESGKSAQVKELQDIFHVCKLGWVNFHCPCS